VWGPRTVWLWRTSRPARVVVVMMVGQLLWAGEEGVFCAGVVTGAGNWDTCNHSKGVGRVVAYPTDKPQSPGGTQGGSTKQQRSHSAPAAAPFEEGFQNPGFGPVFSPYSAVILVCRVYAEAEEGVVAQSSAESSVLDPLPPVYVAVTAASSFPPARFV
jgi:hypothetical protein